MTAESPDLRGLYRKMVRIRRVEETLEALFKQGELYGSLHLCIGQEATAVGACAALRTEDAITCTYRGHGAELAKGLPLQPFMAEMFGKQAGANRGRGGSMLFSDLAVGVLFATGIVAGGLPIAVGAALSARLAKNNRVALAFFGDGATNQGTFHETLNMAGLWKLPVIFFCENNQYSEMTPISHEAAITRLADRGCSSGVPGVVVDGNDVEAVYATTAQAVDRARRGEGPTLIEGMTYRLTGHMFGDTQPYRSRDEVEQWRAKDPLELARRRLRERGVPIEAIGRVDAEVEAEIQSAIAFARSSPEPSETEALANVYV